MATTKLGNSKSCSKVINYAEKRAVVKDGVNCSADYAKSQMKAIRALHGKEDGVQAHTIIQSFMPGEITPEKANQLGCELASSIAEGHQVAVYTHTDKAHIHNHIIINSVNMETGKKYQSNASQRNLIKSENDRICKEHGLSVVSQKADIRYTLAEKALLEKGEPSWKDEVRSLIDEAQSRTSHFKGFSAFLEGNGVKVSIRGKNITYTHLNENKKVRGSTLGDSYAKERIENEFTRRAEEKRIRAEKQSALAKIGIANARFDRTADETGMEIKRTRKQLRRAELDDTGNSKQHERVDTRANEVDSQAIETKRELDKRREAHRRQQSYGLER